MASDVLAWLCTAAEAKAEEKAVCSVCVCVCMLAGVCVFACEHAEAESSSVIRERCSLFLYRY